MWMMQNFFCQTKKELDAQIKIVRLFSQDIGMKFGIKKYERLIMNQERKRHNRTNSAI